MISNSHSRQSIPSKRRELQGKEDRWANLRWAESFQKLAQPKTSLVCAASATALVIGTLGQGESEVFTTGLQSATLDDVVATSNEKLTGKKWSSTSPEMEILEYGLAVETDDLLVPVTWDIDETEWTWQGGFLVAHLTFLQHSTMLPHPEAGVASVRFLTLADNEDNNDIFPFVRIEICRENVAFTVSPTKPGSEGGLLFIFDWKVGRFKAERVPVSAEGIAFLHDDILVNANARENSIDVYIVPPISDDSGKPTSLEMIKRFLLPSIHPNLITTALDCLASPNSISRFSYSSAHEPLRRPFTLDPSLSIIVFTFQICSPEILVQQIRQFEDDEELAKGYTVSMVVHRQALLSWLSVTNSVDNLASKNPIADQIAMEWESWGPNVTRWFEGIGIGCTPPRGQRCIDNPIGDTKKFELDVLDFNPWNVKFAQFQVTEGTAPSVLVSVVDGYDPTSNRFSYPDVFPKDVHCCLPYVRLSTLAPQAHWCTYITEDYLVDLLTDEEFQELDRVVLMKF